MRLQLMATYLGVPYQAGLGPDGADVTLFSPGPPPEELGFTDSGGHWRKQVGVTDLDALWQSRPVGEYRGEPCLVLDDLGSRLHIAYLGRDTSRAIQLGYWEIDREVFEVVVARQEVTGLAEERVEFPLTAATFPPSGDAAEVRPQVGGGAEHAAANGTAQPGWRAEPEGARGMVEPAGPADLVAGAAWAGTGDHTSRAPDRVAAWHGSPWPEPWPEPEPWPVPEPWAEPGSWNGSGSTEGLGSSSGPGSLGESGLSGGQGSLGGAGSLAEPEPWEEPGSWGEPGDRAEAATAPPPARRGAGKDRVSPQSAFAELLGLAAISPAAYAVNEEVPGAMCLVKADGGFEVFSCTEDARLEVRFFEDEEAAYFYLFGVLAAEAIHSGRLGPRVPGGLRGPARANGSANGSGGTSRSSAPSQNVSK
jgi:hypothetical protein